MDCVLIFSILTFQEGSCPTFWNYAKLKIFLTFPDGLGFPSFFSLWSCVSFLRFWYYNECFLQIHHWWISWIFVSCQSNPCSDARLYELSVSCSDWSFQIDIQNSLKSQTRSNLDLPSLLKCKVHAMIEYFLDKKWMDMHLQSIQLQAHKDFLPWWYIWWVESINSKNA